MRRDFKAKIAKNHVYKKTARVLRRSMKTRTALIGCVWLSVFFLGMGERPDFEAVFFQQPKTELKLAFVSNNLQNRDVEIQMWAQPFIPAHDEYYTEIGFKIDNSAWHYAEVNQTQKMIRIAIEPENCSFTVDRMASEYHQLNITNCAKFETLTLLPSHVYMQRVAVLYGNLVHVMWDFTNETLTRTASHSDYTAISVVADESKSWFYNISLTPPQWHAPESDRFVLRRNNYHAEGTLFAEDKNHMRFDDTIDVCSVASQSVYFEFQCAQGYYRSEATETCIPCQEGKYKNTISDDNECIDCPYPTGTTTEGQAQCEKCPAGKAVDNSGICTACEAGKYREGTDLPVQCTDCPPGSYLEATGATTPLQCQNCSVGRYSNQTGATSPATCIDCRIGTYSDALGRSVCSLCSAGKSTENIGTESQELCVCDLGYRSDTSSPTDCIACEAGKFNDRKNSSSCSECSKGTYQEQSGQSTCIECKTTQFSAQGSVACSDCPHNAGSPTGGLGSSAECKCKPGFYLHNDACIICNIGAFKDTYSNGSCTLCPNATFQNEPGQTTCKNCSEGRWSLEGAFECEACGVNAGGDRALQSSDECQCKPGFKLNASTTGHRLQDCEPCGAGFFAATYENRESCSSCSVGKFSNELSADSESDCQSCKDDEYAPLNSSDCLPCKGNRTSNDNQGTSDDCECNRGYAAQDSSSCIACASGKYKDKIADEPCTNCPVGTHMPHQAAERASECKTCSDTQYAAAGSEFCDNCPNHSHSLFPRKTSQDCYCNAGYNGANGKTCHACPGGTFKSNTGHFPCLSCSSGKYSNAIAATSSTTCTTCPPASYADFRSTNCPSCPSNSDTWSSRRYLKDCKCNRGYTGADGGTCEACPFGKFKMRIGDSECVECSIGSYTKKRGAEYASECISCPSGMEPNPSKSDCEYSLEEIAM